MLVDRLKALAEAKQATPAQIAIAWLLAQQPWIVPIPGTTKTHRLQENIGAAHLRLSAAEVAQLEAAVGAIEVQGGRYGERQLKHLER